MSESQHYTFGDDDVAAQRLVLLADAFEPSTRAWLQSLELQSPELSAGGCVVDLGCGPGLTSALLAAAFAPSSLHGLDQSERLLARARTTGPAGAQFVVHDVSVAPLPVPPADVLYARFLLTHLAEPVRVLQTWAQATRPGGVLLLEEVAGLASADPTFTRYYQLVAELQAHYGQATYIGRELVALGRRAGWTVRREQVAPIQLSAATMARLHVLNLNSWGRDAHAEAAFDRAELAEITRILQCIADGAEAPPVECRMAQAVFERPAGTALGAAHKH